MQSPKKESFKSRIKKEIKREIAKAYRYKRIVVALITFIILIAIYFTKDASSMLLRYTTFIGFILGFYICDHLFDVRFEFKHYFFILFIGASTILFSHFYFIYHQYDKVQHFLVPILLCSMFFFMINRLNLALKWKIIFTVLSIAGILGMFEIGEYLLDLLFNLKLQGVYLRDLSGLEKFHLLKNPWDDTMVDMSFGIMGSLCYALYAWIKYSNLESRKHIK